MSAQADLLARARARAQFEGKGGAVAALGRELADALADSVPREQYDQARRLLSTRVEASRLDESIAERDEACAERDALAHVIEQAKQAGGIGDTVQGDDAEAMWQVLNSAPAVSLARHDAEVKAQALEAAATSARAMHDPVAADCEEWASWLDARAAAIRAEVIS